MKKTVKVVTLLLCAITMVTVLDSCSKENSYKKRIIGKWQYTREYAFGHGDLEGESYDNTYTSEDGPILVFNEDGILILQNADGTEVMSTTYTISENAIVFLWCKYQIIELTNTIMILQSETSSSEYTIELKRIS